MKKYMKIIMAIVAAVGSISCELDNYAAPQGCIYGEILDSETMQPMPLPVESTNGVTVSLMEVGTDAKLAQSFYAKFDGSFRNALVFDGDYTVSAAGPFAMSQTYPLSVKGETRLDMVATPYSRIDTNVTADGKKVTVSYQVSPTDDSYRVTRVYILWNIRKETDIQVGNYATSKIDLSGAKTGSYIFNFENDNQYNQNIAKIAANGGRVYIRVAAECNGNVNYSKVTEIAL